MKITKLVRKAISHWSGNEFMDAIGNIPFDIDDYLMGTINKIQLLQLIKEKTNNIRNIEGRLTDPADPFLESECDDEAEKQKLLEAIKNRKEPIIDEMLKTCEELYTNSKNKLEKIHANLSTDTTLVEDDFTIAEQKRILSELQQEIKIMRTKLPTEADIERLYTEGSRI
ncbi:MAG: hypothetical protein HYV41_01915 [Candidatus Magasanikbacteria bacterium]|nr:hypothetical protein [Candidatus Magasanikbacteria bacterium]